ncbi:MAG: hypothetical protein GXX86_11070 [Propionibacterium sp.]|nr:hypothetical protein [Propionibacterium sp.]
MRPAPLDEYPLHQTPLSFGRVATSDRNFYDRSYFNAHRRSDDLFLIAGLGVYPNLGVTDAFACIRLGDRLRTIRYSDALHHRSTSMQVGGMHIEPIEPLRTIRMVSEHEDLSFDLTWNSDFLPDLEEHHLILEGPSTLLDTSRFTQAGTWAGTIVAEGETFEVTPDLWLGTRDRSWGVRQLGKQAGEGEPIGRPLMPANERGFWWLYCPLMFDDFAIHVILQEQFDGRRTMNHATRTYRDGRSEQLGWPRSTIRYRSGTRIPEHATIEMTERDGTPLVLEVDILAGVPITVTCGYGKDRIWRHGDWKGENWSTSTGYDANDPEFVEQLPYATFDWVARGTLNGREGWGMFEHAAAGRHDPSGFTDARVMAP